ncbi:hypothetical protein BVG16_05730 [Paenibacillus selenitireducens]|uniref:Uncharacterized protein n=1 Tax=Paenibacillus selenitireducens TaxID=1324314 RepID=A0A1T2XK45_9BACL|nr:hypothetical protein [Paenibacillus selenitireducens]OPA80240.1 hypothetical protein BVG16_05730 [Paenibacillus selenitireducens]
MKTTEKYIAQIQEDGKAIVPIKVAEEVSQWLELKHYVLKISEGKRLIELDLPEEKAKGD